MCLTISAASAQSGDATLAPSRYSVAVLDFAVTDLTGAVDNAAELGRAMSVSFQTPLVQSRRFTVLTRNQLDEVLNELALNQQGVVNPDEAQRLGQLTGVEVIITGTIIVNSPTLLSVTANFIDVESGEVAAALTLSGSGPEDFVRLAQDLVNGAAREFPPQGSIVEVDGEQVYINLGNETGLNSVSATGAIYRTSSIAGLSFSEQIGTFEVTQIGPQVSRVVVLMEAEQEPQVGDVVTIQALDRVFIPDAPANQTDQTDMSTMTDMSTESVQTTETTASLVGLPSGPFGTIALGTTRSALIAATNDDTPVVYHTYVVDVPPGTDSLDISLDGGGGDIDLVVKAGSEIVSYAAREEGGDWDYLDFSLEPNPSYRFDNPPAGPLYIDVVNLLETPLTYTLSVSVPTTASSPVSRREGEPSGSFGSLVPETPRSATLAAADEANDIYAVYHTYVVDVPAGTESLGVSLEGSGGDLDVALKAGSEITSYQSKAEGGDWDYLDFGAEPSPSYRYENPPVGPLYIDVVNRTSEPLDYTLSTTLTGPSATAPASAPAPLGMIGPVTLGRTLRNSLAPLDEGASYHTYTVDVPAEAERLVITLEAEQDLDLAIKYGSEILSYSDQAEGGDWDYLDMSRDANTQLSVPNPQRGVWYVDVINALGEGEASPYDLRVDIK